MTVQPFTVRVSVAALDDLHQWLVRTRWPDEDDDPGWVYGTDPGYLRGLVAYWQDGFDWRAQEALLNSVAQFRATVGGVGIHFVHERGSGPDPLPLILTPHETGDPRLWTE